MRSCSSINGTAASSSSNWFSSPSNLTKRFLPTSSFFGGGCELTFGIVLSYFLKVPLRLNLLSVLGDQNVSDKTVVACELVDCNFNSAVGQINNDHLTALRLTFGSKRDTKQDKPIETDILLNESAMNHTKRTFITDSHSDNYTHHCEQPHTLYYCKLPCNGVSVTAGGSATALLFSARSSPSELTLRPPTLLEKRYGCLLRSTTDNQQKNKTRPIAHEIRPPPISAICFRTSVLCHRSSGSNVAATVAQCYGVLVHDQLGFS
ncbi:brachyury protein [Trichinella spiralis]|uniref:brachyury protein n=1 Tax=Trichinella spiralis TaxID=6334 RepID=UPI0001EFD9F7|nr:brachyury protein [Trichinella spiralis]